MPSEVNVSDRDYFQAQVERDAATFIGAVLQPRVTRGEPFFGVSHRRAVRNGEFSGIVTVFVVPTVFTEFYKRLAGETATSFTLLKTRRRHSRPLPDPARRDRPLRIQ